MHISTAAADSNAQAELLSARQIRMSDVDHRPDWLPLARKDSGATRLSLHYIKANKHKDWFMGLAWAIHDFDTDTQCRMLAKVVLFLRDFLPRGFVGKFAHIRGNDVMRYLLCHDGEHTMSRHKVTVQADVAFDKLEAWMARRADWKDALKKGGKARGLYTSEAILAMLVIAHPDQKFRNRISRLGIEWMASLPRGEVDVQHGFWKGLNADNLRSCFRDEEEREASTVLSVDYDKLLGEAFQSARKDMRPYLPQWAAGLSLSEDPSDWEETADVHQDTNGTQDSNANANGSPAEKTGLQRHLYPRAEGSQALESWLIAELAGQTKSAVLDTWCQHWAGRMDAVQSYEEQTIIRSLFLQSLCRLKSISSSRYAHSSKAAAETTTIAYLLLDIEDAGLKQRATSPEDIAKLSVSPKFAQFTEVTKELARKVAAEDPSAHRLLEGLLARQRAFFWELIQDSSFLKHANAVMEFDTMRTQVLLGAAQVDDDEDRRAEVMQPPAIHSLKLTNWQIRQLALPKASTLAAVLADSQLHAFRAGEQNEDSDFQFVDLSKVLPVTPQRSNTDGQPGHQDLLRKLFGKLHEPTRAPSRTLRPSAEGTRSRSTRTSRTRELSEDLTSLSDAQPPRKRRRNSRLQSPIATRSSSPIAFAQPDSPPGGSHSSPAQASHDTTPTTPTNDCGLFMSSSGAVDRNTHNVKVHQNGHINDSGPKTTHIAPSSTSLPQSILRLFPKKQKGVKQQNDTPKRTGIWDMTRDDFRADIADQMKALKGDVDSKAADVKLQLEALRKDINTSTDIHRALQAMKNDLAQTVNFAMDDLQCQLRAGKDDIRAAVNSVQGDMAATKNLNLEAQNAQTEMKTMLANISQQLREAKEEREAAKEAKDAPQPGEDGFLATECPAPEGWSQSSYHSTLLRAAVFYMQCRGLPDDHVDADRDSIQATLARYPQLANHAHVVVALNHLHILIYEKPFCLEQLEDEVDGEDEDEAEAEDDEEAVVVVD